MRFLRRMLPHLTTAMGLSLLVIFYCNNRNPTMGFLTSRVSGIFFVLLGLVCILEGVTSVTARYLKRRRAPDRSKPARADKGAEPDDPIPSYTPAPPEDWEKAMEWLDSIDWEEPGE